MNSTLGLLCRRPGFTSETYGHLIHDPREDVFYTLLSLHFNGHFPDETGLAGVY